jgi:putative DNA primase/helicase
MSSIETTPAGIPAQTINSTVLGSEDAIAVDFRIAHKDRLRYVDESGDWMLFNGQRWARTPVSAVWNALRPIAREHAERAFDQPGQRRSLLKSSAISGSERLARGSLLLPHDAFDADPWMLNTPAGMVDLRTGEISPAVPEAYCTKMTAVAPGGECPRWHQFLAEITGSDEGLQRYLQRVIGYSLVGQVFEHVLIFLYGTGANGKGTFLNTVAGVLADYAKVAPMDTFTDTRNERHPADMAMLRGARLVTAQETDEGRYWSEAKVKALTGGDPVSARFMRQDFFTYTPQFTLVVAGNHKPRLRNVDEAFRRRIHMVPFTVTIPEERRDSRLMDTLRDEWSGILQWAIDGCRVWQELGGLEPPAIVRGMTTEYLTGQDPLTGWLEDCCRVADGETATPTELFESYTGWCRANDEAPEGPKRFSQLLEGRGFNRGKVGGQRVFRGVKVVGVEDALADLADVL